MATNRGRSNRSIGAKISDIDADLKAQGKSTAKPHLFSDDVEEAHLAENSVSSRAIAPDAVTSEHLARGAVGTENLGIVNEINSDGSLAINVPEGNIYLTGTEYALSPGQSKALVVDDEGKVYLGNAGGGVPVAATPPTGASSGDLWYDTNGGSLYIYYNDGTSAQWVSVRLAEPAVPTDLSISTLRITSTSDVTTSSTAHGLQIGPTAGANVRYDGNEIQALSNGTAASLNLQLEGGPVNIGAPVSSTTTHALRGWMRMQDLPAFQAKSTANQTFSGAAASVKATLAATDVNNGGHYSTANSRFTAPVAGLYVFSYNTAQSTTVGGPEVELFVNGSQRYGDLAIGYATSFMSFGGSWVVNLAASDFVEIFITNNNGVTLTLSAGRSWFSGFYLG